MRSRPFPQIAELTLMAAFAISFVFIIQVQSQTLFQIGLAVLIGATLLEIGVGNLPADAGPGRSLALMALFLSIIAGVFLLGIALVPYLTGLGR